MPLIINILIIRLGQASFSAYLLHFAIIDGMKRLLPASTFTAIGPVAVVNAFMLFAVVLLVTGFLSQITYRLIELPAVQLGQQLNNMLDRSRTAVRPVPDKMAGC